MAKIEREVQSFEDNSLCHIVQNIIFDKSDQNVLLQNRLRLFWQKLFSEIEAKRSTLDRIEVRKTINESRCENQINHSHCITFMFLIVLLYYTTINLENLGWKSVRAQIEVVQTRSLWALISIWGPFRSLDFIFDASQENNHIPILSMRRSDPDFWSGGEDRRIAHSSSSILFCFCLLFSPDEWQTTLAHSMHR